MELPRAGARAEAFAPGSPGSELTTPAHERGRAATPATRPAISVRGLGRAFRGGGIVAIDSLDLDVAAGEFLAILGPSGCGKSTLLRLVAGLDDPTAGTVRVAAAGGALVDPREQLGKRRGAPKDGGARVAFVFQDPHLLPWRTVAANVALPLEQVRLADAADRYPAELSGGMRMRVSIARALVIRPSLLLLDEPFAALDEITRQALDESLRGLWQDHGLTVVFVTHSIAEAAFLAERAIVMAGPPARVVHDDAIRLPRERGVALRGEPAFAAETARLYAALARGSSR